MRPKIILIAMGIILMMGLASAIYPGECDSFNFSEEGTVSWIVEGNSTPLNGFTYTQNGTNIEYCFSGDFVPDIFTLTFFNEEEVVASVYHSSGGGSSSSSSTVYVVDNVSGKDYGDASKYPTYNDKEIAEEDLPEEEPITIELITEEGKLHWILWLLGGVLILLTIYFIFFRREHHTLSQEEYTNEENLS